MLKFISAFLPLVFSLTLHAQEGRNVSKYNLEVGTGLKGYDPVAVFPEGGGSPAQGKTEHSLLHAGVLYYFASAANMKRFSSDPEKYEPTYGGWCAYAMASGAQVDIDPTLVTISGRRAHYFVARRAKASFDRDVAGFEANADREWRRISGEAPRR